MMKRIDQLPPVKPAAPSEPRGWTREDLYAERLERYAQSVDHYNFDPSLWSLSAQTLAIYHENFLFWAVGIWVAWQQQFLLFSSDPFCFSLKLFLVRFSECHAP